MKIKLAHWGRTEIRAFENLILVILPFWLILTPIFQKFLKKKQTLQRIKMWFLSITNWYLWIKKVWDKSEGVMNHPLIEICLILIKITCFMALKTPRPECKLKNAENRAWHICPRNLVTCYLCRDVKEALIYFWCRFQKILQLIDFEQITL